jgi:hypothetical protein
MRTLAGAVRSAPGVYHLAFCILALGIGASIAVFTVVDGVVLRPLPYPDAGRLVAIRSEATKPPYDSNHAFSYSDFEQFRAQSRSFSDIAVTYRAGWGQVVITGDGGRERVRCGFVSPNFFPMIGRAPKLGRVFTNDENERGERVLVISELLAARRFGSPEAALGRELEISGRWKIVGVMAADVRVPFLDTQLWAPRSRWPGAGICWRAFVPAPAWPRRKRRSM